ncbi:MAG: TolC family protein, partial [Desulfobacterales bacterium]|nr:TolC family protein [Desulfobacterales bacterium]
YLPGLDLTARYYVDDPDMAYDLDRENWTAAVVLNWDLFTGFSRPARISRAKARLKELLAADRKTLLEVQHDVRRAWFNLEDAAARHEAAKQSAQSAQESFRLVQEHYQGGAVTITRFLEAELDYRRARIRAAAAGYDKIRARAEAARAIGLWASQETKPFLQMQPQ